MLRRRFRRRPPPWFWLALLLAAVLLARWRLHSTTEPPLLSAGEHVVSAILDGRTLQVEPGTTIRLLGLAVTDESAAREFLEENLVAKSVRVELDKRRRANDGSQLAYVYLDDTLLNAELIQRGWAKPDVYPGDSASHAKLLREASTIPRDQR